ncbi:MAG: LacI family DNA-binding transcriptional regulator [Bacteroidia bacterium]
MHKKQIRLADIARQLGISTATVSRALKDYPDISPETKKRVVALARELNYRPNSLAAGLRNSETRIIGVIIPEIVNPFFAKVIKGIMEVAYEANYKVMLCQSDESFDKEVADAEALLSSRVDGLLVSVCNETHDFSHIHEFRRAGSPVVVFDKTSPELEEYSSVLIDDYQAAFQATEALINGGSRHIAHITGPDDAFTFTRRKEGYLDALEKHGLKYQPDWIQHCPVLSHEAGRDAAETLMRLKDAPDAIFAATDLVAIGAIVGVKAANKKIPDDVSVIGFSDWEVYEAIDPPLSCISQPAFKMGMMATKLLLEEIQLSKKDKNADTQHIQLDTTVILRGSVRAR